MFQVEKRDGTIAEFQMKKITDAIGKAFGAKDMQFSDDMLQMLALRVTADFQSKIKDGKISVEAIQDSVENVLIQCGYAEVAKAYILYRKQREKIRNMKSTIVDYKEIVDSYVKVEDWRVKENSTVTYSVGGLILSNSGAITANYWLSEIYDDEIAEAHRNADIHIHDFKRKDKDGNYRQLHTKEAAECIDYTVLPDYRQHYTPAKNQGVSMVQCPYFTTAVYDLDEPMTLDYSELDSFVILIGLKGEAKITDNEGNEITLQGGESIVVPASTKTLKVEGTLKFLEVF